MTFPVKFEDAASSANFPTEGAMGNLSNMADPKEKKSDVKLWDYTDYEEDIYVVTVILTVLKNRFLIHSDMVCHTQHLNTEIQK